MSVLVKRTLIALCLFSLASAVGAEVAWPLLPSQAEAITTTTGAMELQKGVFYYHYLNEDYQAALNQLTDMRSEFKPAEQAHLDVLETTLLLALGLDTQAQRLFAKIEQQGVAVPGQVWLYLARRWQIQGQWEALEYSTRQALLGQADLSDDQYQEALYLLVSSFVEQDRLRSAQNALARMEKSSAWALLAQHNLLVSLVRNYASLYDIQRTIADALMYAPKTPVSQAVADHMNLIGGIFMLQAGRNREAEHYLSMVSQHGPYSAEALLQYGWAKVEQSKYFDALQPWRELQLQYADWHPAVVESILAVPYTMEMMNASTQALRSYEQVELHLHTMLSNIEQQQQPAYQQQWLADWLLQQQGEWGWRRQQTQFDQAALSHNFMGLTAQSAFRELLGGYFDTVRMRRDLVEQQQHLALSKQMVEQRQQLLQTADGKRRLAQLKQHQTQLLTDVAVLEARWQAQEKTIFSYASQDQQTQLKRLDNVVNTVKYLQTVNTPSRNLALYKERWRRNRGLLLWEMSTDQSARQWQATSEFWQLHRSITAMKNQLSHSQQALLWSDSGWYGLTQRIEQGQAKIQQLDQQLAQVQTQQQQQIQAQITQHLQQLTLRLTQYQAQTRLALARLYDDALQQHLVSLEARNEGQL